MAPIFVLAQLSTDAAAERLARDLDPNAPATPVATVRAAAPSRRRWFVLPRRARVGHAPLGA